MTVRVVDRGWDRIMKAAQQLAASKPYVAVGVIGSAASADHDGPTNVEIATVHEYGAENIPQRSFIGSTIDENEREYISAVARAFRSTVTYQSKDSGVTAVERLKKSVAMRRVGLRVVGDIQGRISDGIPPPNSPITIARKGSSKPLIDSGQLRQSISFEVRS